MGKSQWLKAKFLLCFCCSGSHMSSPLLELRLLCHWVLHLQYLPPSRPHHLGVHLFCSLQWRPLALLQLPQLVRPWFSLLLQVSIMADSSLNHQHIFKTVWQTLSHISTTGQPPLLAPCPPSSGLSQSAQASTATRQLVTAIYPSVSLAGGVVSVTAVPQSTSSSTSIPTSSSMPQAKTSSAVAAQPHTQADAQLQSQVNMQMENERGPESRKEMEKQRDLVLKDGHQTPPSGLEESVQPSCTSHTQKGKSNLINFHKLLFFF